MRLPGQKRPWNLAAEAGTNFLLSPVCREGSPLKDQSKTTSPTEMAELLAPNLDLICQRWLDSVRRELPFTKKIADRPLLDSLPKYLEAVVRALRDYEARQLVFDATTIGSKHGWERSHTEGYGAREVAIEYSLLREILFSFVPKEAPLSPEAAFAFHGTLDAGALYAIQEFLKVSSEREKQGAVETVARENEELKSARAVTENALQRLQDFLMQAPEPMAFLAGPEHRFSVVNQPYINLIGRDPTGQSVRQVFSAEEAGIFFHELDKVFREGKPFVGKELPFKRPRPGGALEQLFVDVSYFPVLDESGRIVGISAFVHDVTHQREAREKLEAAKVAVEQERENLRHLFKQTPEMVCILSGPELRFEFVNEAHVRALGFNATGRTLLEAQPESVEVHGILERVYRTGETAQFNELAVTLGQAKRYFNATYAARRNFRGEIDGVTLLGVEITEQVLAREGTRLQKEALELAMGGSATGEVLATLARMVEQQAGGDLIASVLLADEEAKHLLHGAAPHLPDAYNRAIHGIDIGNNVGSCGTAAFTKKPVVVEDIATDPRWADFKTLALEYGLRACWSTPILGGQGKLLGTFAFYSRAPRGPSERELQIVEVAARTTALILDRKASEKKATEASQEAERAREELFSFFMQAPTPMVIFTGPEHHFTLANPPYERYVGRKVTGLNLGEVFGAEEIDLYRNLLDRVYQTGEPYVGNELPLRLRKPDGSFSDRRINVSYTPFRNQTGEIRGILVFIQDVTEQAQARIKLEALNADLAVAKDQAEQANEAKSAFLANMSHEIRTPLGSVMGFVELMKDANLTRQELSDYVGVVERNSQQVLRIIDDILDLAKIEAGKLLVENIVFSVPELIADFSSLMGFRARENGIDFSVVAESRIPECVSADPTRLRQILTNIVGNAIKFTERGSVEMSIRFEAGELYFAVRDTGRGISPEQAAQLFQPFVQADASTTRKFGGTGLGLALTRRLATAMGGGFFLSESRLGAGSVFVAHVRAEPTHDTAYVGTAEMRFSTSGEIAVSLESKRLKGLKVLVVDDSPDNQTLLSILLKKAGATVDIATDGQMGIDKAVGGQPDVVLMDIQMPRMDGYQALKVLRERGFTRPVIALTAHAMKEERERAAAKGFVDFTTKPINREVLLDMVEKYKPAAPTQLAPKARPADRGSVLVVEDDEDTRMLVSQVISGLSVDTHTAPSGKEALAALRGGLAPDLILLDLTLPDLSGEEVLAEIRADRRLSHIRVIVVSGWDDLATRAKAIGADGSMRKPIHLDELENTVRDLLGRVP